MTVLHGFESPATYRGGVVSIGNFDGVHRGHQAMLASLTKQARAAAVPSVVLTFDPHPIELLRPDAAPPRLTTISHRAELLRNYGVDTVIILPTTKRFLTMTAEEFFHTFVRTELQARGLVEGPNFYFGRNREGSVDVLRKLCQQNDLTLEIIEPVIVEETLVSSSVIRGLIEKGSMQSAVQLLGHAYRLEGKVVTGAQRGRLIGFPTANLAELQNLAPATGVYAATSQIEGETWSAAVNIGPNPTFGESGHKIEVHLLDFQGDLYGQDLKVEFLERIREVRTFASVEELIQQLSQDVQAVRRLTSPLVSRK